MPCGAVRAFVGVVVATVALQGGQAATLRVRAPAHFHVADAAARAHADAHDHATDDHWPGDRHVHLERHWHDDDDSSAVYVEGDSDAADALLKRVAADLQAPRAGTAVADQAHRHPSAAAPSSGFRSHVAPPLEPPPKAS
jgi:hypothetical protein